MKKFLLLIALAMTFIVTQASEIVERGNVKYQIDDNGITSAIGLSASGKSQSFIDRLDLVYDITDSKGVQHNVTRIADNAFEGCDKAVFYAERDSYGWNWAIKHGFEVKHMKLFVGKGLF